jgi:stage III sporulation protein AA
MDPILSSLITYVRVNNPVHLAKFYRYAKSLPKFPQIDCSTLLAKYTLYFTVIDAHVQLLDVEIKENSNITNGNNIPRISSTTNVSPHSYSSMRRDIIVENVDSQGEDSLIDDSEIEYSENSEIYEILIKDDGADAVFEILPSEIATLIREKEDVNDLSDVILDLGKPLILLSQKRRRVVLWDHIVDEDDIMYIQSRVTPSTIGNRCTISDSLNRCSLIVEPDRTVIGMTIRIGREITGIAETINDILVTGASLLIIGKPGAGKTTLLRDIARLHSTENEKIVMVIDTTCEIAGDGRTPHASIGLSRRMKVNKREDQHKVMMEAVQNHNPDTIIIDEIGMTNEAIAAKSISERGVQLIGTTHGVCLTDLIRSPELKHLLGGFNTAILSEKERKSMGKTSKTIIERKEKPTFDVCIELLSTTEWRIHHDVGAAVDAELRNKKSKVERRTFNSNGDLEMQWINFPYQGEHVH